MMRLSTSAKGSPVIHLHGHASSVAQALYLHAGVEWKRAVSRGERVRVEHLSAGGRTTMKWLAVPRSDAGLSITSTRGQRGITLPEDLVRATR